MNTKTVLERKNDSLNSDENLTLAKEIVKFLGIEKNIPRSERLKDNLVTYGKTGFFFKKTVPIYEKGVHVEFNGKRLKISQTNTDLRDYGLSSYAEFQELDDHIPFVNIGLEKLVSCNLDFEI